jgi:hypothetical protein
MAFMGRVPDISSEIVKPESIGFISIKRYDNKLGASIGPWSEGLAGRLRFCILTHASRSPQYAQPNP